MRITYREKTNKNYWTKRWTDIDADEPMKNEKKYPLFKFYMENNYDVYSNFAKQYF